MASHNKPSNSAGGRNPRTNITAVELRRQREAAHMRRSQRRLQRVEEPLVPLPPAFPPGIILGENLPTTSLRNRMFSTYNNIHVNPNHLIHQRRLNPNNSLPIAGMNSQNWDVELRRSRTRLPALGQSVLLPPTFPPGITVEELPLSANNNVNIDPNLSVDLARLNISNSPPGEGRNSQHLHLQEINNEENVADDDGPNYNN